jgi:hypothetical protein
MFGRKRRTEELGVVLASVANLDERVFSLANRLLRLEEPAKADGTLHLRAKNIALHGSVTMNGDKAVTADEMEEVRGKLRMIHHRELSAALEREGCIDLRAALIVSKNDFRGEDDPQMIAGHTKIAYPALFKRPAGKKGGKR